MLQRAELTIVVDIDWHEPGSPDFADTGPLKGDTVEDIVRDTLLRDFPPSSIVCVVTREIRPAPIPRCDYAFA